MVQVKEIEKSSPELQALIESEVKQLLRGSSCIWVWFDNIQFKGTLLGPDISYFISMARSLL